MNDYGGWFLGYDDERDVVLIVDVEKDGAMQFKTSPPASSATHVWVWTDGSDPTEYKSWAPGEPNNWGGGQNCGLMWHDDKSWDDQECGTVYPYLCSATEKPAPAPAQEPEPEPETTPEPEQEPEQEPEPEPEATPAPSDDKDKELRWTGEADKAPWVSPPPSEPSCIELHGEQEAGSD
eukprot:30385-Rhodomonas_salina.1